MRLQEVNHKLLDYQLEITQGARGTWVLWDISGDDPVVVGSYTSPFWAYLKALKITLNIPSLGYRESGEITRGKTKG